MEAETQIEPEGELDEEEEPILKYQLVGADLARILEKDVATCLTVHESFICLGTRLGRVYVLDFNGHELRRFRAHTKQINDISIDDTGEFICSGGEDGLVIVHSMASAESVLYNYFRSVHAAQIEPAYASKRDKVFGSGGASGQLVLNKRGWIIENEAVLDDSEGSIDCIRWKGSFIAWSNQWGAKVYDVDRQQKITFIEKPPEVPSYESVRCCLFWDSDTSLIVGWGDTIKARGVTILDIPDIVQIRTAEVPQKAGLSGIDSLVSGPQKYGEITAIFQMDFYVSGISGWDNNTLAVLGCIAPGSPEMNEDEEKEEEGEGTPIRIPLPELHLVSKIDGEDLVDDALPIKNFERYRPHDYQLASTVQFHPQGETPVLYIKSPKEVIVVRNRSPDDRIAWALAKKDYLRALHVAQNSPYPLKRHNMDEIVSAYLGALVADGKFEQAANEAPALLKESATQWEKWVWVFAQKGHIGLLAPLVPTSNPRLSRAQYDLILKHYLEKNPKMLLKTLRTWPKPKLQLRVTDSEAGSTDSFTEEDALYDTRAWIQKLEMVLRRQSGAHTHQEIYITDSLAELYCGIKEYDKALSIYLEKTANRTDSAHIFELIKTHALWDSISDKVYPLMQLDLDRGADLLARNTDRIPVQEVVRQLDGHRKMQHWYLHNLFEKCPDEYNREIYADFHDLQVSLYADFNPERLVRFLQVSNFVSMEKAFRVCKEHEPPLYNAMILILGRLGNTREALDLIITKLGDVQQAIEFVQEHEDDLWDYLIQRSLTQADFVSELLNHAGSHGVDPAKLISQIPEGMQITGLRDKVIKIISDYNIQLGLRQGSSKVFASDCTANLSKLLAGRRRGVLVLPSMECLLCEKVLLENGKPIKDRIEAKITAFHCGHAFHQQCADFQTKEIAKIAAARKSLAPHQREDLSDAKGCVICYYGHFLAITKPATEFDLSEMIGPELFETDEDLSSARKTASPTESDKPTKALSTATIDMARRRLVERKMQS